MIESTIVTKAPRTAVWALWKKAHSIDGDLAPGRKGKRGSLSYCILEVTEGSHFTVLWKSLFVKLRFSHAVTENPGGSKISYQVQILGPFAWPMRILLRSRIKRSLVSVLQSLSKELNANH